MSARETDLPLLALMMSQPVIGGPFEPDQYPATASSHAEVARILDPIAKTHLSKPDRLEYEEYKVRLVEAGDSPQIVQVLLSGYIWAFQKEAT